MLVEWTTRGEAITNRCNWCRARRSTEVSRRALKKQALVSRHGSIATSRAAASIQSKIAKIIKNALGIARFRVDRSTKINLSNVSACPRTGSAKSRGVAKKQHYELALENWEPFAGWKGSKTGQIGPLSDPEPLGRPEKWMAHTNGSSGPPVRGQNERYL